MQCPAEGLAQRRSLVFWTAFLPFNAGIPFFLWHRYSGVPVTRKEKRRWEEETEPGIGSLKTIL